MRGAVEATAVLPGGRRLHLRYDQRSAWILNRIALRRGAVRVGDFVKLVCSFASAYAAERGEREPLDSAALLDLLELPALDGLGLLVTEMLKASRPGDPLPVAFTTEPLEA